MPSAPALRKPAEPVRREPREIPDRLAPARGIAIALGIGALAWIAVLLATVL